MFIFAAMFFRHSLFILISISLLAVSCSKFQKIYKGSDNDLKYTKAMEYYEKKDYYRALQLFDQLLPVYRATGQSEIIYYRYAYAYYYQGDYILASYYFDRFTKTFPRSEKSEECMFMVAYCKYLDSPRYNLDQSNTTAAIQDLQLFIDAYPNSSRLAECNQLIDTLRYKLELKSFEVAKLYYKMDKYKAAIQAFKTLLRDYPGTRFKEDALFLTLKSHYYFAVNSITNKKKERYEEVLEAYKKLKNNYPETRYSKEAEAFFEKSNNEIKNL